MEKVLLAIGHRQVEDFIKAKSNGEYAIVGTTVYRGGIIKAIKENKPDVIVLFESLKGNENISDIIYEIRANYKNVRIIFGSNKREPGDVLLATIVGYGIYDILYGEKINANEIIRLIKEKNEFSDVFHLRPKTTVDEKTNQKLYDAPTKVIEKPVIKEIYLDKTNPNESGKEEDESPKETNLKAETEQTMERIAEDESVNLEETKSEANGDEVIDIEGESVNLEEEVFNLEEVEKKEENINLEEKVVEEHEMTEEPLPERNPEFDKKVDEKLQNINENLKEMKKEKPEKIGFFARLMGAKENTEKNTEHEVQTIQEPIIEQNPPEPEVEVKPEILPEPKIEVPIPEPKIVTETIIKETIMPVHMKQKILTFLGSEQGVGNSQIAFNTALHLAKSGFRTMYIDFKETGSTVEYLYQLGTFEKGLDIALRGMENQNYTQVEDSIISMSSIISNTPKNSMMLKNYKQFPDLLDLLFYSEDYVTKKDKEKERINSACLKDLFMYFIIQKNYDFIILDVPSDLKNEFTKIAMAYSTKIFLTLTQDVSHIGGWLRKLPELTKRINLDKKIYYIINKYEKAELNQRDISEWMKVDIPITIPSLNKDFINANYIGLPVLLYSKNKELKKAFASIEKIIFE